MAGTGRWSEDRRQAWAERAKLIWADPEKSEQRLARLRESWTAKTGKEYGKHTYCKEADAEVKYPTDEAVNAVFGGVRFQDHPAAAKPAPLMYRSATEDRTLVGITAAWCALP